jgi:hypothetical protein
MTKRPAKKPGPKPPAHQPKEEAAKQGEAQCQPIKRQPKLFMILLIAFGVWLGVLLTLYFSTVYPLRYPSAGAATRPGASALPNAPR